MQIPILINSDKIVDMDSGYQEGNLRQRLLDESLEKMKDFFETKASDETDQIFDVDDKYKAAFGRGDINRRKINPRTLIQLN